MTVSAAPITLTEHDEAAWVAAAELDRYEASEETRRVLQRALGAAA